MNDQKKDGPVSDKVLAVVAELVTRGRDALDDGDLVAARKALVGAASRLPRDRDVLLLRATLLCAEDEVEAALDVIDGALEIFPNDISLLSAKAFMLLDVVGDVEEALPILDDCLAECKKLGASLPGGTDLMLELSLRRVDALMALGDVAAAVAAGHAAIAAAADAAGEAESADEANENLGLAHAALARGLLASGDLAGAKREIASAAAKADLGEIDTTAGRIAVVAGDDAAAKAAFARAFEKDPDNGLPPFLSSAVFRGRFDAVVNTLPPKLQDYVGRWPLVFAERSDVARLTALGRSPETPLLLEGTPPTSGDPFLTLPTTAIVHQRNLESLAPDDGDSFDEVVLAVVVESIGSFLGVEFDEDLNVIDDDAEG